MVTLTDYLYSGDTIFKIIQNYMTDLRKEAKRTHNEIDLVHSNCLLQVQEMLEHNDFLTSQSQKIPGILQVHGKRISISRLYISWKNQIFDTYRRKIQRLHCGIHL